MKIIFIGTPEFAATILEKIAHSEYKPVLVITAPDKPVGRKQIITPPPVKIIAEKNKISVAQFEKIQDSKLKIQNLNPDLIIVAAYGQIIPKEILNIPRLGCLNIHPSLLPKYRGSSPIQTTILRGDKETGVTIILMNEKMDQGKIVDSIKHQVSSGITCKELSKELAEIAGKLLIETIPKWEKGEIKPKTQDESRATYTKILKKIDGKIDWQKTAEFIERQIRAFNPWPGSFTKFQNSDKNYRVLKILKATVLKEEKNAGSPGKTFLSGNGKIGVKTGKNFLIIELLQPEGKSPMASEDFLRGHKDFIGKILE